ncbi:sulfotransferase family protein [Limobrevibacterium gyesilva]|uniref:Sulfotransferase n=1 Tax=Limobrevibacterium gyesilva TaxID=2991712 RepID=A0AA41YQT7_9PROT|nr:sulfotransferase [Limobrevibacterium gyesilva]MCW3477165.1 sulfotransferase [Limobrevibacterium gyesilva]
MTRTFALRTTDRLAAAAGLLGRPFDAGSLMRAARRASGLDDFGAEECTEPLRILLQSYAEEADLSLIGRMAVRWDMVRFLSNLLRLREEERRAPAILRQPVDRPIFITGLPRSGTTFLHTLLAEDPANLVPRYWQTVYPYPLAGAVPGQDRRVELVARQLRLFARLAPEFPDVHPVTATSPQECSEITAHVFRSLRFDTTHRVPSYLAWLDRAGHDAAYRFHRRFLQHLLHQIGPDAGASMRCVLKCPDHIFALDAIRTVYPDARYVFVHRDPLKVLASVARLTEILREPFTRHVDRAAIGRQECDRWAAGAALMTAASATGAIPSERIFHIHHTELIAAPMRVIAELYRHFGLPLPELAAQRINAAALRRGDAVTRRTVYRLEDFAVAPEAERRRFAGYVAHFRIDAETPSRSQARHAPHLAA